MKAETQLGELRTEIDKLSAGHEQGAKVLRRKAQALAALPREMRDAIFEQIYVQKNPIVVSCSRHGNGLLFDMPKDTALYMSSLHVGESLAREAAEIFWKSNTFTFNIGSAYRSFRPRHGSGLWVQSELDEWSTTDHYGSGNPPQDYIRHASLRINRLSYYYDAALTSDWQMSHVDKICNHIYFESICRDVVAGSLHDYRERLRSFLGFSGLKSLKVEIGDFVLAVGSPFGLSQSVTQGIISAKGRRDLELGDDSVVMQDFLQTDAAINPGNSGGPLLNLRGEVIGINTAIASSSGGSEGIGFTIPINMAMVVARQLVENGRVRRAYLGVRMDYRFSTETARKLGLARPQGVRVTGITAGSPAERAGIKVDDVLLKIDGVTIDDDDHLANLIGLTTIGKSVTIELWRQRGIVSLQTQVGERRRFESN